MKNKRIKIGAATLIAALFTTAFTACNLYEHEELEIRRCPQVRDTVQLSEWERIE